MNIPVRFGKFVTSGIQLGRDPFECKMMKGLSLFVGRYFSVEWMIETFFCRWILFHGLNHLALYRRPPIFRLVDRWLDERIRCVLQV